MESIVLPLLTKDMPVWNSAWVSKIKDIRRGNLVKRTAFLLHQSLEVATFNILAQPNLDV